MARATRIAAACAAALVLGALAEAPAAFASGWMVGGASLSGSEKLRTTAKVDEKVVVKGAGVTIACEGSTINALAPQLESPNKASATSIEFTGCEPAAPCHLSSSTVKTEPVIAEATLEGALAYTAVVKPKAGTLFTTVTIEGSECSLEGSQPITGQAKALAPTGQMERTLQSIESITREASGELKAGSSSISVTLSVLGGTASGKPWSLL